VSIPGYTSSDRRREPGAGGFVGKQSTRNTCSLSGRREIADCLIVGPENLAMLGGILNEKTATDCASFEASHRVTVPVSPAYQDD
jgi:hypothetical protein